MIIFASVLFLATGFFGMSGAAVSLPKTGQTVCYDAAGNTIDCVGTGQDGELQMGVPWPTPRYVQGTGVESDCMLDTLTGLMWPRVATTTLYTWQEALDYANGLSLCGHDDWRLPNLNELGSLNNANEPYTNRWLNSQGFSGLGEGAQAMYLTSSTLAADPESAWFVWMHGGNYWWQLKTATGYAFPVRGTSNGPSKIWRTGQTTCYDEAGATVACAGTGQDGDVLAGEPWPAPRFNVMGDCVQDNLTGYMWLAAPDSTGRAWLDALTYANTFSACGYDDWRLPNKIELRTLASYEEGSISGWLNNEGFTGVTDKYIWTSDTFAFATTTATILVPTYGHISDHLKTLTAPIAWPVRSDDANITVDPTELVFDVYQTGETSPAQEVTITNSGTLELVVVGIEITGTGASAFAFAPGGSNPCSGTSFSLPFNTSCTLEITYAPTATGYHLANLVVNSNDPDTPASEVALSGGAISGALTIWSPNGGEVLATGGDWTIRWGTRSDVASVKLFYSVDKGQTWKFISEEVVTETNNSKDWIAPLLKKNKVNKCLLKAKAFDSDGKKIVTDKSDKPFTIEVVKLTSPNDGGTFGSGEAVDVTWTTNTPAKPVAEMVLHYSLDNGSTWKKFATQPAAPGTHPGSHSQSVALPDVSATKTKCKIKVVLKDGAGNNIGSDVSELPFTITGP
jgi:hypothetical protein